MAPNYTGAMDLNTFEFIGKTENKARLYFKKIAGKTAMFFAQGAGAIKPYGISDKDIGANAVVISFMTLPADGLIDLKYRIRNGSGS